MGKLKGYILGAVAAASYGLNPTFTLPLYSDGLNPDSVLLLRYGFAVLAVALMILFKKESFHLPKSAVLPVAVLGVLMALSSLTLFESYNYMAAGIASTILFVYPILVAVIMTLFCGEKLTLATVICLITASIGISLLYKNGDGETLSLLGTMIVIASALSYALYLVGVGHKRVSGLSSLTLTFYVLCFGSLLFAGRIASGKELVLPSVWYMWIDAFALAVVPTTISLLCTAASIKIIGSTPVAILGALEPVTAVIMGVLLFSERMTAREATGVFLILAAVTIVVLARKKV